jgi:hypothetical protein
MTPLELADALEQNGEDCTCRAACYYECGCDAIKWPEQYMLHAAAELRRLHAEVRMLQDRNKDDWK